MAGNARHTLRLLHVYWYSNMATPDGAVSVKQESSMDRQTMLAVLQFLKKNNLKVMVHRNFDGAIRCVCFEIKVLIVASCIIAQ